MKTVIFTSFFSAKKHPQIGDKHVVGIGADGTVGTDFKYIEKWYNSIQALDLDARIFCDNLPDSLIEAKTTDKIQFVKVAPPDQWSNNDYRFFCFQDYLETLEGFDAVFSSDGSDVLVKRNPSEVFALYPERKFFACQDSIQLSEFPYLAFHTSFKLPNYTKFYDNATRWPLINMGVLGAKTEDFQRFLKRLNEFRKSLKNQTMNLDMWTGQYILRTMFAENEILIGEPVTSRFKKYENRRNDVFFVHK